MTVYVDDSHEIEREQYRFAVMVADTETELHEMARKVNLEKRFYRNDRYLLSMSKRTLALRHSAVATDRATLQIMIANRTGGREMGTPKTCRVIRAQRMGWRTSVRKATRQHIASKPLAGGSEP